jgi:hypothetical protein
MFKGTYDVMNDDNDEDKGSEQSQQVIVSLSQRKNIDFFVLRVVPNISFNLQV